MAPLGGCSHGRESLRTWRRDSDDAFLDDGLIDDVPVGVGGSDATRWRTHRMWVGQFIGRWLPRTRMVVSSAVLRRTQCV